jgi:demethylmenaquinone methyltransferase/2-methoxy-6-polyprenyl-1,4-benzoquinol methylase
MELLVNEPMDQLTPERENVHRMFDRIAHRYDLLNHLLSANRDKAWRQRMIALFPEGDRLEHLDLATGTADQLLTAYDSGRISRGIGLDPSEKMLALGRKKITSRSLEQALTLQSGNAEQLPFADRTFDLLTISFGIRNVTDVPRALSEMQRVLRPGGRALILEFSLPSNRLVRKSYLFYFRHILPRLGGLISGDSYAYRYLNRTVETFPYGHAFCSLMSDAGLRNVRENRLTFGIATIYQGDA